MSKAPNPMVFVKSVRLGKLAVSELVGLVRRELQKEENPPIEREFRQILHALSAFLLTDREVEIRVVPDEEDEEE